MHERASNTIRKRESTLGKPRFLGVPQDNQLLENSSMEGIFNGRTISDVHRTDSAELERAGYTWDQGVRALQALAVACEYTRQKGLPFNNLPGFRNISMPIIGHQFQFFNPIDIVEAQGEPISPLERISGVGGSAIEFAITLQDPGGGSFKTIINQQTLYLAEAHHLLEKGNNYALTGEQLGVLIKNFDQDAFEKNDSLQEWMKEEADALKGPYSASLMHKEKITFVDNNELELKVNRIGSITLLSDNPAIKHLKILVDNPTLNLKTVQLIGRTYNITCFMKDGNWWLDYFNLKSENVEEQIPEESPLFNLIDVSKNIIDRAKVQNDKILSDEDAIRIHEFMMAKPDFPATESGQPDRK